MELLRERRLELGLTQQQLADACGIRRTRISEFESGRKVVPTEQLAALLKALALPALPNLPDLPPHLLRELGTPKKLLPPSYLGEAWWRFHKAYPSLAREPAGRMLPTLSSLYRADCVDECLGLYSLVAAGARLHQANPHQLGFARHPVLTDDLQPIGNGELPCLSYRAGALVVILWPQTTLRLQDYTCRVDLLVRARYKRRKMWGYCELDGTHHSSHWDERRHRELRLPVLRLDRAKLLGGAYVTHLETGIISWFTS